MKSFFGSLIVNVAEQGGSFVWGFALLGLLLKLIFLFTDGNFYKSVKTNILLQPYVDDIFKHHPKNSDARNEMISKLLMNNKCSMFAGIGSCIVTVALGICMMLVFREADFYIFSNAAAQNLERGCFLFSSVTMSPVDYYKLNQPDSQFIMSLIVPFITIGLTILHDSLVLKYSVVDQKYIQYATWVIYFVMFCIVGEGFTIMFCVKKIIDLFHLIYAVKFIKIQTLIDHNGKPIKVNKKDKENIAF